MRMTNDKPFNFPNVLSRENCLLDTKMYIETSGKLVACGSQHHTDKNIRLSTQIWVHLHILKSEFSTQVFFKLTVQVLSFHI